MANLDHGGPDSMVWDLVQVTDSYLSNANTYVSELHIALKIAITYRYPFLEKIYTSNHRKKKISSVAMHLTFFFSRVLSSRRLQINL